MMEREELEQRQLQQLAYQYRSRGYEVLDEPSAEDLGLPATLRPDLIAMSPTDRVIIEVRSRQSLRHADRLEALAAYVQDRPGWRLELVVVGYHCVVCLW